jgi:phosphatidyl-myo-inositol dimannoside synthase
VVWSAHVNFGPLLSLAARVAGAPTVLNVYGLEIWSGLSARRRAHMARAGRIVSDCHFTANYVRDEPLHHVRPTVIWDCVDLDRFRPTAADAAVLDRYGIPNPSRHFLVMSLGRLARAAVHKGFDRLIEASAALMTDNDSLRLVIAGRGDDQSRLQALAEALGIAERVVFTGPVHDDDLPAVYGAAHVFSLVSDRGPGRGEGIPLTPLEAMACGVPIIVGDEDGSREAVVEDRNGMVVSPRRLGEQIGALRRLIGDDSLRRRMSHEAVRVAAEHFSYAGFVAEHRRLLGEIAPAEPIAP